MIVGPAVLAFGLYVVDGESIAVYAFFAAFVGLVFADYGGTPQHRAVLYGIMVVLGGGLIVLGAVLSTALLAGMAGMFVVVSVATLTTTFGGQTPLFVAPMALAYSLSVLQPTSDLAIVDRLAGWALGGVAALAAALVLWPGTGRLRLGRSVAELATALSGAVGAADRPDAAQRSLQRCRSLLGDVQSQMSTPQRPFGPGSRSTALVRLVDYLGLAVDLVGDVVEQGPAAGLDAELRREVAAVLERAGRLLAGDAPSRSPAEDLRPLAAARAAELDRLVEGVAEGAAAGSGGGERLLGELESAVPLRVLAHVTTWIETESAQVAAERTESGPSRPAPGTGRAQRPSRVGSGRASSIGRASRIVAIELDPEGVILKNSVRAGAALAVAVGLAELLPVDHGFWIALASLCVLRSGAHSTYACALQALVGTVVGFGAAALLLLAVGESTAVLWVVFPFVVLAAGYTPGGIHFAVGQAAFTVAVVNLFGLLGLPGFSTAIVRVETVTVGAAAAVVLGLVLWPRGARSAVGRTIAEVYRATAAATATFVVGTADDREQRRHDLAAARRRAVAAFAAAVAEHSEPIDADGWLAVYRPSTLATAMSAGLVRSVAPMGGECGRAVSATVEDAASVGRSCDRIAARLDVARDATSPPPDGPAGVPPAARSSVGSCLEASLGDADLVREALVITAWSTLIGRLRHDISSSANDLDRLSDDSAANTWLVG